jgi:anti-sigma factor RsiW
MSCDRVQPELVAFHFGVVGDELRRVVEEHLPRCERCLADYLALKREIETAESEPRPSPAARAKLRRAVAEELGLGAAPRAWSWWERPLAFGFASAAVLAAVFAVNVVMSSPGSRPRSLEGSTEPPAAAQDVGR